MRVAVFDTYVVKKNGMARHFEIIVREDHPYEKVIQYGLEYLKRVGQEDQPLTKKECLFWHIEVASENLKKIIQEEGHCIYEIKECN